MTTGIRRSKKEWVTALLPYLVALAAALVTAVVTWTLVREDAVHWESIGLRPRGELRFVYAYSLAAGAIGWFVGRRLFQGPAVSRFEWSLLVPRVTPRAEGYRTMSTPTVADLIAALGRVGYSLAVDNADELGRAAGPCEPRTPLVGARIRLTDKRLDSRGSVVVRLSERTHRATGVGFVEAVDVSGAAYDEMGRFAIASLAALFPGLTYKPLDSSLTPDDASLLAATLPERPAALPGSA